MERQTGLLDRTIKILEWNRSTDLYLKRYLGLYNINHNGEEISNKVKRPSWPPMGKGSHPL